MKSLISVVVLGVIVTQSIGLKLVNNGYEDLYIVLQDSIEENFKLIDRIKVKLMKIL